MKRSLSAGWVSLGWSLLAALVLLPVAAASGQEKQLPATKQRQELALAEEKIPPARAKYMGRKIAQTMSFHGASWLIRSEREQEERPSQVLPQLGLKSGMTVCDMGCGNGFYSIEMAKRVAPGKVLAVDIQQEMLHLLKLRADEEGIDNIKLLLGTAVDPHYLQLKRLQAVLELPSFPSPSQDAIQSWKQESDSTGAVSKFDFTKPPLNHLEGLPLNTLVKFYGGKSGIKRDLANIVIISNQGRSVHFVDYGEGGGNISVKPGDVVAFLHTQKAK